jgi:hypothetical protein
VQVSQERLPSSDTGDRGRLGRQLSRRASRGSRSTSAERKRSLSRKTSFNSAGPSFSMGIATNSALEDPETPRTGEVPPMPAFNRLVSPRSRPTTPKWGDVGPGAPSPNGSGPHGDPHVRHMPTIQSFAELETPSLGGLSKSSVVMEEVSAGYESEEVRHAILHLDNAIELVKARTKQTGAHQADGALEASAMESSELAVSAQSSREGLRANMNSQGEGEVQHCVSVLDMMVRSLRTQSSSS